MTFSASSSSSILETARRALDALGAGDALTGSSAPARSPITGENYGEVGGPLVAPSLDGALDRAQEVFLTRYQLHSSLKHLTSHQML